MSEDGIESLLLIGSGAGIGLTLWAILEVVLSLTIRRPKKVRRRVVFTWTICTKPVLTMLPSPIGVGMVKFRGDYHILMPGGEVLDDSTSSWIPFEGFSCDEIASFKKAKGIE